MPRYSKVNQSKFALLGLMIWQGLHSGEITSLKIEHIHLRQGFIYIPSTGRSNGRELKLSSEQILSLHQYIEESRIVFLPLNDKLIIGNVNNIINLFMEVVRGINPMVKNALQIRGSVILHWLKQYNKRQVQYMAGHKYISSTEEYAQQNMESLTDELSKHHPFG